MWVRYYNDTERELGKYGEFENIRDFAAKSAENAVRIAANFHVFNCEPKGEIDKQTMRNGINIAYWHLQETKRILGFVDVPNDNADATLLLGWLLKNNKQQFSAREISQKGPNSIRQRPKRDNALQILCENGYLVKKDEGGKELYDVNPAAYEK